MSKWYVLLLFIVSPVLKADELTDAGRDVFETIAGVGCASCHGQYAEGDVGVGPYIRGASEGMVRAAIEGNDLMIAIQNAISEREIEAVSAYLQQLGSMQVARTLLKRGRFIPDGISVRPGTFVQVIIENAGFTEAVFSSREMSAEPLSIAGRATASFDWQAPDETGTYSLACINCKLKDQTFTIIVDPNAPEFRSPAPGATNE